MIVQNKVSIFQVHFLVENWKWIDLFLLEGVGVGMGQVNRGKKCHRCRNIHVI